MIHFAVYETNTTFKINYIPTKVRNKNINKNKTKQPQKIFKKILSITQLLEKYELTADKIFFDSDYDLTLYFGGVRVTLGSSDEIDEKIMRLQYILPQLEGKSGTLRMENHTEDTKNTTFDED